MCQTTVNVLNFQTVVACQKGLDKQCRPRSGSSLFAILISLLRIPALNTNILFENRKRKVLEILEHLPHPFGYNKRIHVHFMIFKNLSAFLEMQDTMSSLQTIPSKSTFNKMAFCQMCALPKNGFRQKILMEITHD